MVLGALLLAIPAAAQAVADPEATFTVMVRADGVAFIGDEQLNPLGVQHLLGFGVAHGLWTNRWDLSTAPADAIMSRAEFTDDNSIIFYVNQKATSDGVKTALQEVVRRKQAIQKVAQDRQKLEQEIKTIDQEQSRIRQNLQSVGQGSDLGRRYLDTLKSQEDRLAEINRTEATLENEIAARRQSAEELAQHLTL